MKTSMFTSLPKRQSVHLSAQKVICWGPGSSLYWRQIVHLSDPVGNLCSTPICIASLPVLTTCTNFLVNCSNRNAGVPFIPFSSAAISECTPVLKQYTGHFQHSFFLNPKIWRAPFVLFYPRNLSYSQSLDNVPSVWLSVLSCVCALLFPSLYSVCLPHSVLSSQMWSQPSAPPLHGCTQPGNPASCMLNCEGISGFQLRSR